MIDVTKAAADYLMNHFEKEGIDQNSIYVRLYMAAG